MTKRGLLERYMYVYIYIIYIYIQFFTINKMSKEIIMFGNIQVEKHKFPQYQSPILIYDVDISKIVISNSVLFVKKALDILYGAKMVKTLDLMCNASKNKWV